MRIVPAAVLLIFIVCLGTLSSFKQAPAGQNPLYPTDGPMPSTLPAAKAELAKAEKFLRQAEGAALLALSKQPKSLQSFKASQRSWAAYVQAELLYDGTAASKPAEYELSSTNIKALLTLQRARLINNYFTLTSTVTDVTPKPKK